MCVGLLLRGLSTELTKIQFFLPFSGSKLLSLSPHYEHKSLVSLETWGNFCTWIGISYCSFTTQSGPHLWKNHLQVSSSEIFSLLFFPLCNKMLKILVSVSSVDVPFPGLHSVILHVFPWCPCHASLTAQLLGL